MRESEEANRALMESAAVAVEAEAEAEVAGVVVVVAAAEAVEAVAGHRRLPRRRSSASTMPTPSHRGSRR